MQIVSIEVDDRSKALEVSTEVLSLLEEYASVFKELKGLPPCRGHEHQILLKPCTQPTCQRPTGIHIIKRLKLKLLLRICLSLVQLGIAKVLLPHQYC